MSPTMFAKEFLAMHFAFDEFAHILWGVKKPTIVMTDNKALTRFFQSKRIPPKLWKYCDQTLQFEFVFVLAYVPGTENPAADYLSRLDIRPKEKSTSNSTTRYQSSTSRSTWHQEHPSRTKKKKNTYLMTNTLPPPNKMKPSTPSWTRSPCAATNRVDNFSRG